MGLWRTHAHSAADASGIAGTQAITAKRDGTAADPAGALGRLPEWNLTDLYEGMGSALFEKDMERARHACSAFAADHRGGLAARAKGVDAGEALAAIIQRYEEIQDLLGRIMAYAGLVYSGDTTDAKRSKFFADTQERITAASSQLLFFPLELNRLDEVDLAEALLAPALAHYRSWLEDLRLERPYQLDDRLERLFHEKAVTASSAWHRLFDDTIGALVFRVEGRDLPLEPALNLMQDTKEALRKEAAEAIGGVLHAHLRTFTLIANTLAKDKEISDRWRRFGDVADSRHLSNRIESGVVAALVEAVRDAYPRLSHRYYRLKAGWLGKDKLNYWDRNAPLPASAAKIFGWDEARETVLEAYAGFSPRMACIAKRFFDERWIDAPVRPGKTPGAFAHPTVPSSHPYVLLNYQGRARDVMTLAHELGHGVHQVLAAPNGALMAPTPLTLAETASVFGEMLTFRALLAKTRNPGERRSLLAAKVEDVLNTVVRQVAFYTFERALHSERRTGELVPEQICELWLKIQSESLGSAVRMAPSYGSFWAYVPHFVHSPFYVYAYAFGDCLVHSLFEVYQEVNANFADRYLAMLAAGGTKHHSELLAPFGLDARDPGFWQIGLRATEALIDELDDCTGAQAQPRY